VHVEPTLRFAFFLGCFLVKVRQPTPPNPCPQEISAEKWTAVHELAYKLLPLILQDELLMPPPALIESQPAGGRSCYLNQQWVLDKSSRFTRFETRYYRLAYGALKNQLRSTAFRCGVDLSMLRNVLSIAAQLLPDHVTRRYAAPDTPPIRFAYGLDTTEAQPQQQPKPKQQQQQQHQPHHASESGTHATPRATPPSNLPQKRPARGPPPQPGERGEAAGKEVTSAASSTSAVAKRRRCTAPTELVCMLASRTVPPRTDPNQCADPGWENWQFERSDALVMQMQQRSHETAFADE
jgi:hypothetical protein